MMQRLTYRRTTWIVDAHCDDVTHFVVHADEKLTRVGDMSKHDRSSFLNQPATTHRALCLMHMESLAKMSRRNYKSSFSQADNSLEKRLCIAPPLVLT